MNFFKQKGRSKNGLNVQKLFVPTIKNGVIKELPDELPKFFKLFKKLHVYFLPIKYFSAEKRSLNLP